MKANISRARGAWGLILLVPVLVVLTGCDYFNLSNSSDEMTPSPNTGSNDSVATAASNNSSPSPSSTAQESTAQTTPPAPITKTEFAWIPGADSVVVKIPAQYAHWKFWVFSRRKHATLYGPDYRAGNKPQEVVYTLEGGGAAWRQKSRAAGDDGTLLVIVNTKDIPPGAEYRNAAWRIMNPTAAQYGDGDRLMPGDGDR